MTTGEIIVNGVTYNNTMALWASMTNELPRRNELYLNSWGNKVIKMVTEKEVSGAKN